MKVQKIFRYRHRSDRAGSASDGDQVDEARAEGEPTISLTMERMVGLFLFSFPFLCPVMSVTFTAFRRETTSFFFFFFMDESRRGSWVLIFPGWVVG